MKRRWPRFSLRTLIIGVLGIAVCWTLTATWGVKNVLDKIPKEGVEERSGNTMRSADVSIHGFTVKGRLVRATAIAPFIIRVTAQQEDAGETVETFFWFFGYDYEFAYSGELGPKK